MDISKLNPVILPDGNIDWEATGKRDGIEVTNAQVNIKEGLIGKLLELAEVFGAFKPSEADPKNPAEESWLKGYGIETNKSQKSEAKAVFEAYAKDQDACETAALEVVGKGIGQSSRYHQFIEKCRDIRGRTMRGGSPQASRKVTASQVDATVKTAGRMDYTQAAQVMQAAAQRVSYLHVENADALIVGQIKGLAETLRNKAQEPLFQQFGRMVEEKAEQLLERHNKALDKAKAKQSEAVASKGVVPTPAMQGVEIAPQADEIPQQVAVVNG